MAASSIILTVMTLLIRRQPRIESADNPVGDRTVTGSVAISVASVVAFVLGVAIPGVNYWALFVLFLSALVGTIVGRRLRRG